LPPVEYPGHFIVKHVTNAGTFRFKKRLVFIANALIHHRVGLEEVADGIWSIYFCRVLIGRLDERDYAVHGTRWVWKSKEPAEERGFLSSPRPRFRATECYPCCRFTLLPMFPVAQRHIHK
jgi:hypothetical protein